VVEQLELHLRSRPAFAASAFALPTSKRSALPAGFDATSPMKK
jgi:hypothetical protein